MGNFFQAMEIAASGLSAQRVRMNALSSNLANAHTTRTAEGGPYRRIDPVFKADPLKLDFADYVKKQGRVDSAARMVRVAKMQQDTRPPKTMYDPLHPDADDNGMVSMPNVEVVTEMVNMITASRSYESGVTVMSSIKKLAQAAIRIVG